MSNSRVDKLNKERIKPYVIYTRGEKGAPCYVVLLSTAVKITKLKQSASIVEPQDLINLEEYGEVFLRGKGDTLSESDRRTLANTFGVEADDL